MASLDIGVTQRGGELELSIATSQNDANINEISVHCDFQDKYEMDISNENGKFLMKIRKSDNAGQDVVSGEDHGEENSLESGSDACADANGDSKSSSETVGPDYVGTSDENDHDLTSQSDSGTVYEDCYISHDEWNRLVDKMQKRTSCVTGSYDQYYSSDAPDMDRRDDGNEPDLASQPESNDNFVFTGERNDMTWQDENSSVSLTCDESNRMLDNMDYFNSHVSDDENDNVPATGEPSDEEKGCTSGSSQEENETIYKVGDCGLTREECASLVDKFNDLTLDSSDDEDSASGDRQAKLEELRGHVDWDKLDSLGLE